MTSTLRQRAAQQTWPPADAETSEAQQAPEQPTMVTAPLEAIDYDSNEIRDADTVPVHIAWSRVMADVQSIAKKDQRADSGGRYDFRGVDRVVNAVGPALRRHGVLMLPTKIVSAEHRESRTANGKTMQECILIVQWTVIGPNGDQLPPFESVGQATDTQDKGSAKASSVAQRVAMLTALHVPTQDPDIDRGHERGERPLPKPADYRDEITDPRTSMARLKQIRAELRQHNLGAVLQVNESGDDEPLLEMRDRIAKARFEAGER